METLKGLAEEYAQRDDLYTENGEYTKRTVINAFNDGAKAMLQVIGFSLAAHRHKETKVTTKKEREWLIEQINRTNMEAQELRIGNKIWRPCCYDEVVEIRENGIIGLDSLRGLIPYSDIEPIPITEELLLKNGFTDNGKGQFYYHLKDKYKTTIRCATDDYKNWFVMVDSMRYENFISTDVSHHNAQYIHELQNVIQIAKVDKDIKL